MTPSMLDNLRPSQLMELNRELRAMGSAVKRKRLEAFFPLPGPQTEFFKSRAQLKMGIGGNRSGKSEIGAVEMTHWLRGSHPYRLILPPVHAWIVVNDATVARDVILPKLFNYIPEVEIRGYNKQTMRLELTNGSIAQIKSTESPAKKFESAECDVVWIDEECPREHWDAINARTGKRALHIILTMTPLDGMDWSYDEIYCQQTPGEIEVFTFATADNVHIPQKERNRLARIYKGTDQESARLRGEYVGISGLVYKQFSRERHLIDPFPIPPDWAHLIVVDPHAQTPSASIIGAVSPENIAYIYKEIEAEENLVIKEQVRQLLDETKNRRVVRRIMDPSALHKIPQQKNKTIQDVYSAEGLPCRLGNNDFFYGLNAVNTRFKEGKLFIFKTCPKTAWQVEHVAYKNPKKYETAKRPEQKKRNDHYADCVRYLCADNMVYEPEMDDDFNEPEEARPGQTGYRG